MTTETVSWPASQSNKQKKDDLLPKPPFVGTLYLLVAMAMQSEI